MDSSEAPVLDEPAAEAPAVDKAAESPDAAVGDKRETSEVSPEPKNEGEMERTSEAPVLDEPATEAPAVDEAAESPDAAVVDKRAASGASVVEGHSDDAKGYAQWMTSGGPIPHDGPEASEVGAVDADTREAAQGDAPDTSSGTMASAVDAQAPAALRIQRAFRGWRK